MDFASIRESLESSIGSSLPTVLGAIGILVAGWIVAVIVRAGVRRMLCAVRLNERISSSTGSTVDAAGIGAKAAFYVVILIVLVAFFNVLKLERASGTLQSLVNEVMAYAPKLIAALVLLALAWIVASLARAIVTKTLARTSLDEKLAAEAGLGAASAGAGNFLFWLVILLFLPAVLGALELEGLLAPVQDMVNEVLLVIPNVVAAVAIGFVGWFVAKILRSLVTNLLAATGFDRLGERAGLSGAAKLSGLVGLLVFVFVFVPALIAALNTLGIEAISGPATQMLSSLMDAIPGILGAALIIVTAYVVGRFVATVVSSLLAGIGFDRLPQKIGLGALSTEQRPASALAGSIILFFIMLFATVEAAARVGFEQVAQVVDTLIRFGGDVLLGVVIIAVGVWLANLAYTTMQSVRGRGFAGVVRFTIIGLVLAMGLRAMGVADDIVNLAFGLTLGAAAVAFALAFGLGGRQAAGEELTRWFRRLRGE